MSSCPHVKSLIIHAMLFQQPPSQRVDKRASHGALGPFASPDGWRMDLWRWRPQVMKRKPGFKEKRGIGKTVLRLPHLEIAKSAVLNSLSCPDAQRRYPHAIDEFVDSYCSEPRAWFSK